MINGSKQLRKTQIKLGAIGKSWLALGRSQKSEKTLKFKDVLALKRAARI